MEKEIVIHPVVLCGGSGTRLWPLSRQSFPKQFVPLVDNKSLLQLTLERVAGLGPQVVTVSAEEHRFMVSEALDLSKVQGPLILEPQPRNTAAAMALAALWAKKTHADDSLLLFCPADHHIPDTAVFTAMVQKGSIAANAGAMVTFGVRPSFPSTAYGYIEQGKLRADGSYQVARFIEKPAADKAQALLLLGGMLWNAGIFLTRVDTLLNALANCAPDILVPCEQAMKAASSETTPELKIFVRPEPNAFAQAHAQSIDYAVMEKISNVVVLPFSGQWSDVGSWNAVAALQEPDELGNRVSGNGLIHGAINTFIHAPHRPVVALGTQNLLIIDTPDAVLVAHPDMAEKVKDVVARLNAEGQSEAVTHRKVARPWGWYDSIDRGERFQVKRIGVKPGAALSLQKHHHRAEHWIVVKGTAEVTLGEKTFLLSENESTYIPIGQVHRLHNPGKLELEMIEVQSGSYLGEDDIVRLEDTYGRN
jgi:mannose-1-phosphate guanylyltransferase/mannose-6-phosphate isomerase